jgi:hypothetical protein
MKHILIHKGVQIWYYNTMTSKNEHSKLQTPHYFTVGKVDFETKVQLPK